MSFGAGVVVDGVRARGDGGQPSSLSGPAFYALRAGRLARPRHAAAPALHGLAPQLRRHRRGARAALLRGPAGGRAGRFRARRRRRRARAGRAPGATAAHAALGPHAVGAGGRRRRRRGRDRRGRRDRRLRSPCSRSSPPGRSSCVAYNLELFGGRFHSDAWFALAWGAFPALTGWWACALALRAEARAGRGGVRGAELRAAQAQHPGPRAAPQDRGGRGPPAADGRTARGR